MGAEVTILDIDTAHQVPSRSDWVSAPKPITWKFVRCLQCSKGACYGMTKRCRQREPFCYWSSWSSFLVWGQNLWSFNAKDAIDHKWSEEIILKTNIITEYCWAKNSVVYLRKDATARPIKINGMDDLQTLADKSWTLQVCMINHVGDKMACSTNYYNAFKELQSSIVQTHGQFNNSLESQLPTKKHLEKLSSVYDLDLFCLNTDSNLNLDCNLGNQPACCQYFSPHSFSKFKNTVHNDQDCFSLFHNNIRSLKHNLANPQD